MNENGEVLKINHLVLEYENLRSQYDEMKEAFDALKAQKDAAEQSVIMAILEVAENSGIDDLKVKVEGRNYGVRKKDYYTIPAADRPEAFRILKELGRGDIVVERVDDRTLSSEMDEVASAYRAENPSSEEEFPAEYEELLTHMNRYRKTTLSRVMAR